MYIVDVNKDVSSDCLFFSAFLNLQSIKYDEATTFKELIFFNALTDIPITSQKTRVEVAKSGKTMMFYGSIQAFPKISKNSPISIIQTTDYSKGFLRSLALRIIEF